MIQLEIDRGDGKQHVFNASREPRLVQQGGGEIVVECVGSLIVNGMAGGSFSPARPYVTEAFRILCLRRFGDSA